MSRSLAIKVAAVLVAILVSAGWIAGAAHADVGISAAPSLLEVSATPGGTGSQEITVTNAGTEPFAVRAEVVQYKDGEAKLSAVSWLKTEPAGFELAPGQRRTVKVTIAVPRDAESGGRYAMVAFKTGEKATAGSAVGVAAQVGVPFLITVKASGPLVRQQALEELLPVLEPSGSLGFRAIVANTGNVHYYARGTVDIADGNGAPWGRVSFRDTTAILPGGRETVYSDQPVPFKEGAAYRAKATVSYGEGASASKEVAFTATAALQVDDLSTRTTPAGELDVRLTLKNSGSLGVTPKIMMAVRRGDGKVAGVLSPSRQILVWPRQNAEIGAQYPGKLAPGTYTLVARVEYGTSAIQSEAPFEISGSAAGALSSVPVTAWAEGAPRQAPEVAAAPPPAPPPAPPTERLEAGYLVVVLPLAVLGLVGAFLLGRRGRLQPAALGLRITMALPSGAFRGLGMSGHFGRRRRRPAYAPPAILLPPPPLHLLPPPRETNGKDSQPGAQVLDAGTFSSLGPPYAWDGKRPGENGAHHMAVPAVPNGQSTGTDGSNQRTHPRLARAVAEKAAALVERARVAAEAGDRATVDRLSRQALQLDPWNVDAWLWLAASCEDSKSALMCLEAVLLLDPSNPRAKRGVASIGGGNNGSGKLDGRLWGAIRDSR